MALFMDHHEDLKLPAEVLAQIAEDTRRCHRSGEAPGPAAVPPRYRVGHRATPPHPPHGPLLSARASLPADWRGTKPARHRWTTALRLTCCGDVFVVIVRWLVRLRRWSRRPLRRWLQGRRSWPPRPPGSSAAGPATVARRSR